MRRFFKEKGTRKKIRKGTTACGQGDIDVKELNYK
jgi:hypothetical protein